MINWNKLHDKAFARCQSYIEAAKEEDDLYTHGLFMRKINRLVKIIKYIHDRRFGVKHIA